MTGYRRGLGKRAQHVSGSGQGRDNRSKNEYLGLVLQLIHCLTFESVSLLLSGAVFSSATQQEEFWEHKGCPDDNEDDYGRELQASWVWAPGMLQFLHGR